MAVKKRTTLRSKSSKRVGNTTLPINKNTNNSKKDKIIDKIIEKSSINDANKATILSSNNVIPNLKDPKQPGISKSAIRRRKRKLRDQLAPKLTEDLLDALTESTNTVINKTIDGTEEIVIKEKVKLDHTPNPHNKRGAMALYKIENEKFKQVLKNKEVRNGGLSALRNLILENISKESE